MEEAWRLLGITDSVQFLVDPNDMGKLLSSGTFAPARRSFAASIAAIRAARARLALGYGHKLAAEAILKEQGLLPLHMSHWNPFFFLPHVDFSSFPMDRLHGVYVP